MCDIYHVQHALVACCVLALLLTVLDRICFLGAGLQVQANFDKNPPWMVAACGFMGLADHQLG